MTRMTPVRSMVAASLLIAVVLSATCAAQGQPPWKAGDPAPALAGVRLGDARAAVMQVLHTPVASEEANGTWTVRDASIGVEVSGSIAHGVESILVSTRDAGELGGVRVGDRASDVVRRWGEPPGGGLGAYVYESGLWQVAVQENDRGLIVVIGLALRRGDEAATGGASPPAAAAAPPPAASAPAAQLPSQASLAVGQTFDLPPGAVQAVGAQYVEQTRRDGDRVRIRIAGIVAPVPRGAVFGA